MAKIILKIVDASASAMVEGRLRLLPSAMRIPLSSGLFEFEDE